MEDIKLDEYVSKLEDGSMGCGVLKADKTQCGQKVEDLVVVGDQDKGVLPLCLEHSEGLEKGKAYIIHSLNGKDYAVQLNTATPDAIMTGETAEPPTPLGDLA